MYRFRLKATFFSRVERRQKKTVGAYSHIFSRHAKIDHRQFFHLPVCLSLSSERRPKEREGEEARENERRQSMARMNIDGPSRVWAKPAPLSVSYIASHCFWHQRFIFAATADHFFRRLSSLFARRSWLRDTLTSRIERLRSNMRAKTRAPASRKIEDSLRLRVTDREKKRKDPYIRATAPPLPVCEWPGAFDKFLATPSTLRFSIYSV